MKQKRRGFTLIELLAVIVILAIIALIAVPVIMNIISSARKSAFEDTAYGLVSAGEMYYAGALLNDGMSGDTEFTIENGEFTGTNKLDVKGSLPGSGKIKVSKDGKVALAITNGSICIIKGYNDSKIQTLEEYEVCELPAKTLSELARKNDFATTVNACATTGTCTPGTKFAIEVAPGDIKNFYVISDADNTVTLIMDRNIGYTVAWIVPPDYSTAGGVITEEMRNDGGACQHGQICVTNNKGPITALNSLERQTSSWTNIKARNYSLTDDQGQYSNVQRIGTRARMLTLTEALAVGCTGYYNGSSATCPEWLYDNLGDGSEPPYGFWLSSAYADDAGSAWSVDYVGDVVGDGVYFDLGLGVRPVIEISK